MKIGSCKGSDSSNERAHSGGTISDDAENDDDDDEDGGDGDDDNFQQTTTTKTKAPTTEMPSNDTPLKLHFDKSATSNATDIDVDCDKSNSNLEHAPLIQLSPSKSITLVKQNSTSLIFTKKDVNPVVHRKRVTVVRSAGTHSTSEVSTTTAPNVNLATGSDDEVPIISHTNESIQASKKRHSFHWQLDTHGQSAADKIKRKQIKSWYAVVGSPSVRESSYDSDTQV